MSSGWPKPAKALRQATLSLDQADADTIRNLSASVRIGDTLFLGADEACTIERLTIDGDVAGAHQRYPLNAFLDLEDSDEEADIEGLAVCDGWLWVTGSHARTRPKPGKDGADCIDLDRLANLRDTRPRCLLARIPLVQSEVGWAPVRKDGKRRAGMVQQSKQGSALAKAMRKDPLLGPFTRVPAKEGGLDVEGIAVTDGRVALGLRGPVIGAFAVLLETELECKKSGRLALAAPLAKRLLALEGLGIRDLKRRGDDLLILAGPTTGLSGPCAVYLWRDWANDPVRDQTEVRLHRPERLLDLPFGRGFDHPEGLALWDESGETLLVVCDSPGRARLGADEVSITADLFQLPA